MLPLQQAYGLTTQTISLGSTAVPTAAAASFLADTVGVVAWQLLPLGGTLFIANSAQTNGLTLAAVGSVLPLSLVQLWGPVRFNLAAGAVASSISVTKLLSEGFGPGVTVSTGV